MQSASFVLLPNVMMAQGSVLRALAAAFLVATAASCGGSQSGAADGAAGLPPWEGEVQRAFSDDIDPAAVGLSLGGPSPRADGFLRHRAQTADIVARVRVQTVTVDRVGEAITYHLGIQVGYPALTEPRIPQRTFELRIGPDSPGYAVAKAFDTRLSGMTFVGFIKEFVGEDGQPEIHWHLSPDTAEVAAAVREAVALQEMAGS